MAHNGIVYDSDPHFKINVDTRQITNESSKKTSLIQFDHKSERFSFEMDRFVEGHDMTECNRVEVHFTNTGTKADEVSEDVYDVVDVHTDTTDENKIVFSWLLVSNATKYEGKLKFLIRFACTSDDGTVEYAWHTAKFNNITISKGLNNGKSVVDTYSDILAQWEDRIVGTIPYSDIGSLHGQNKAGFYKVVGRTSLGNYKSVECMLVSFNDTDASTTQHYFFNDGRVQFRTFDIASGWSEWKSIGGSSGSYNDLTNKPITVLNYEPTNEQLAQMGEGIYLARVDDYTAPDYLYFFSTREEWENYDNVECKHESWTVTIISHNGIRVERKDNYRAFMDGRAQINIDWREVPLNDSTATKEYVDSAIGDALEGVY